MAGIESVTTQMAGIIPVTTMAGVTVRYADAMFPRRSRMRNPARVRSRKARGKRRSVYGTSPF